MRFDILRILEYLRILIMILHNEFKPFRKLVYEEGNVRTYKILGSLEILAIKNMHSRSPSYPLGKLGKDKPSYIH